MADIDFLAVHAEGSPYKPALILGERSVDFATLNRRANKAAHVFTELGCEAQDRVAIMSFNSIQGFEISNGLRRVKLIAVPVNYRLRGSEVAYLLNDSGASVVCADDDHVDILEAVRPGISQRGLVLCRAAPGARRDGRHPAKVRSGWSPRPHRASHRDDGVHGSDAAAPSGRRPGAKATRPCITARIDPQRGSMPSGAQSASRSGARPGDLGVLWGDRNRHQHRAAARGPAPQAGRSEE